MAKSKFLVVCGGSGEYLLGQREILNLQGELQIDVGKELDATRQRLGGVIADQIYTIDAAAGAVNALALFEKNTITAKRLRWNQTAINTANFIADNWIRATPLTDGLAQSAAIGGLAINVEKTQERLSTQINNMLSNAQQGDDLEFWIVSSLAGGTGEGIHRAVADKIIEVCATLSPRDVKIRFVRIGSGTYVSCNKNRKLDPTVLALAADAMFVSEMRDKYKERASSIVWYYLDFPDYGARPEHKPIRGSVIELGCKALMQDKLIELLSKFEVNANTIICRVGYWGREYDKKNLLSAALDGLINKLNIFMNPDDEALTPPGMEPPFYRGDLEEKCRNLSDPDFLIKKIDEAWKLVTFSRPEKFDSLSQYLDECERSLEKLLGVFSPRSFSSEYKLYKLDVQGKIEVPFMSESSAKDPGSVLWFDKVKNAQAIRAWSLKLLGIRWIVPPTKAKSLWFYDSGSLEGLLNKLFTAHKECSIAFRGQFYKNSQVISNQLTKNLLHFAQLVNQVRLLHDQLVHSLNLLSESMADAKKVRDYADERKKSLPPRSGEGGAPIVVAELDEILDQLNRATWLQLIYDKVTQKRPEEFDYEVRRGAIGLTEPGLKEVLHLKSSDNVKTILLELKDHVGRMIKAQDNGTEVFVEGQWFGGNNPIADKLMEFYYRMLPKLENFSLEVEKIGDIELLYPPFGMLGLKVLALEGVTLAEKADLIKSHVFLAMPYANALKEFINKNEWDPPHIRGLNSPRMEVASGAVIGEPLSEEVLLGTGLDKEEIDRLREYLVIKTFRKESAEN